MNTGAGTKRLLLISNSTLYGSGYLDHVESEIREFLGTAANIAFIPFAMYDRSAYATKTQERFRAMGCQITSAHDVSNARRVVERVGAIFVGGGNTFRLLKGLYDADLLNVIRERVGAGVPYIGSSAGSIVACPSLKTTKDMPIVQPPSFEALGLVEFQISPHYLDPDPSSTHMGETQEERIRQFLEENRETVVGLREGSMLRVEGGAVTLKGSTAACIFRGGEEPVEVLPVANLDELLRRQRHGAEANP
jgi:dipeptidase E